MVQGVSCRQGAKPSMTRICDRLLEPHNLIALLILGQLTFWTAAPVLSHISPPRDVVEIYLWGREWVIATHKHPGLATWVLEASHAITGSYGWPSYVVSKIFIAITYVFVFVLGCHLMGAERAAAGTLLLTGVAYNAWWTTEFKHNIAEAPFWVGLPWLVWRAVEQRSSFWWLLAGAFAGVGTYARLSVGLVLVVLGVWILVDARARHSLLKPGPWLALVLFIAICAPLGWWLVAQDYALLAYAYDRSLRSPDIGYFLLDTALNLVLVPIMLTLAGLLGHRRQQGAETATPEANVVSDYSRKLRFLLIVTGCPWPS
jgi:4-amino-4-deoxy-L-arabinose transferase-like glycosyltransferase